MKKKTVFIVGLVFFAIMISFFVFIFKNYDSILTVNNCKQDVEKYLAYLPTDEVELDGIAIVTEKVCSNDDFQKYFFFSEYYKDYIYDIFFYGKISTKERDDMKQAYFNEVIMLRLKTLAVLGENEEYESLFLKSVYDIENCLSTRYCYRKYWYKDPNYSIKERTDIFNIVVQGYETALSNTNDDKMEFLIVSNLYDIYASVKIDESKTEYYRKYKNQLITENPQILYDIYELSEDEIQLMNGIKPDNQGTDDY